MTKTGFIPVFLYEITKIFHIKHRGEDMEKNKYKDIVEKYTPKEDRTSHGLKAFLIGGLMGVLGQFLLDLYAYLFHIPTTEAAPFMIITLIFSQAYLLLLVSLINGLLGLKQDLLSQLLDLLIP